MSPIAPSGGSQPFFVQASDPGAVGAGALWSDTTSDPAVLKVRNAADDGWVIAYPTALLELYTDANNFGWQAFDSCLMAQDQAAPIMGPGAVALTATLATFIPAVNGIIQARVSQNSGFTSNWTATMAVALVANPATPGTEYVRDGLAVPGDASRPYVPWSLGSSTGEVLLDITTPTSPAVIAAGLYIVTVTIAGPEPTG